MFSIAAEFMQILSPPADNIFLIPSRVFIPPPTDNGIKIFFAVKRFHPDVFQSAHCYTSIYVSIISQILH